MSIRRTGRTRKYIRKTGLAVMCRSYRTASSHKLCHVFLTRLSRQLGPTFTFSVALNGVSTCLRRPRSSPQTFTHQASTQKVGQRRVVCRRWLSVVKSLHAYPDLPVCLSDQAQCRYGCPVIGSARVLAHQSIPTSFIPFQSRPLLCQKRTQLVVTYILLRLLRTGRKIRGTLTSHLPACCHIAVALFICDQQMYCGLLRIFLQFEAVGSAFYCWVNGSMVGYAQDTFLSSEFDVTELLKPGSNNLAVQVSSGHSVKPISQKHSLQQFL